ncbi:LysE/ArgO family amino acid transporter [Reinekea blandensis]|uniref:Probable transporter n=1 Tax=Reinekea blandensis MED297 TaxID=314283 RepID=A4BE27_9GAMM|nr:LysE family transporter [Reinekea blandensis]EAR09505.1 probable transporter [Reinekea blandensis MED297]
MSDFLTGYSVALGLIVAIGAQNAWVLGMSVRRQHPWAIAVVCFTVDALLMALGVLSVSQIQQWVPGLVPWMTWLGIAILVWLCVSALLRVVRGNNGLKTVSEVKMLSRWQAVFAALTITLLNPHVYLDTVVLVGSLAVTAEHPWVFWMGAALASTSWFSALAALGRPLSRWLSSVRRWQVFDGLMALIMAWVALALYQSL